MTKNDQFVATVAPDGSVTRGDQSWTKFSPGRSPRPGQRWLFLALRGDTLHAMAEVEDVDMPPAELLDRLAARLAAAPEATRDAIMSWAAENTPDQRFLQTLLDACPIPPAQFLKRLSALLAVDRIKAGQAFVDWCVADFVAASTVRTALEATTIADPEAPAIFVRRTDAEVLELGTVFDVGIMVSVSPNGRRICIRAVKDPEAPVAPERIHVRGLAVRSPWQDGDEPYDIILRWDSDYRGYVGILDRRRQSIPVAAANIDSAKAENMEPSAETPAQEPLVAPAPYEGPPHHDGDTAPEAAA